MPGDRLKGPSGSGSAPRTLGHQFHDQAGKDSGDLRFNLVRGQGLPGNVSVDDFHGLPGLEWHPSSEKFIKGGAQGIKITAIIERAVHPAGLLGGDIGQGFPAKLGTQRRQFFPGKPGGQAETVSLMFPDADRQNIERVDHFMQDALLVHFFQDAGQ